MERVIETGAKAKAEEMIKELEELNISEDINDHLAVEGDEWTKFKRKYLEESDKK